MDLFLAAVAIIAGLAVLVYSADRFVLGASGTARCLGMSPFFIGMVIVGFGTSAPEMIVSAVSASQGNPGIAIGNAYGSNIANIALILGVTALIIPIKVKASVIFRELPLLIAVTLLSAVLLWDLEISRTDACILLAVFAGIMFWSFKSSGKDEQQEEIPDSSSLSLGGSIAWLIAGLLLMMGSSRALVWGAVEIATMLEVPDVIIGLTVVAVGTSLPELASSIVAARKGQDDLAIGNIVGSNMFNTMMVVGIAGAIKTIDFDRIVLYRDFLLMLVLTVALVPMGYRYRKNVRYGTIGRICGAVLLSVYAAYTVFLILTALKIIPPLPV